jgi:hypothetical protein
MVQSLEKIVYKEKKQFIHFVYSKSKYMYIFILAQLFLYINAQRGIFINEPSYILIHTYNITFVQKTTILTDHNNTIPLFSILHYERKYLYLVNYIYH